MYSGGGVEPDKRIAGPVGPGSTGGFNVGRFGRLLNGRQAFANYAQKYTADGDARVGQQATGRKIVKQNFVVDDELLADFRQQLVNDGIKIDEAGFTQDLDYIKAMLRFEIDMALFGVSDAWRHLIMVDPQAQMALSQFGEAQKLVELNKTSTKASLK